MSETKEFYRIQKLPPYVFAVINEMKAKARAAQMDVVDLGMGNPDGATPQVVVDKLIEASRNPRNHRYSLSRGIPHLREEIVKRYKRKHNVDLDPDKEAIVTMGAKDALAHLLFATIGPGDVVAAPNPAYPIHQYGVIMSEGYSHMLPMPDADTFLERLRELYRESMKPPKMLLISFPHNPTVTAFAQDYSGNTAGLKDYTSFTQTFGNPLVKYTIKDLGVYLQDQWKVNDRLTVTLGARYERTFTPGPAIENPAFPLTGENIPTGKVDLMPRIGLAYRINDKTVLRAGAGTFFARLVAGLLDDVYTGNGLPSTQTSLSISNASLIASQGPVFPNVLASAGTAAGSSTLDVLSPKLKTPYSEQAEITLERQLSKDMVLSVSGIFSRGVNLYGTQDINAPALGAPFTYTIDDAGGNAVGTYTTGVYTGARPNPAFGAVYEETNGVSSWYDGLTVNFKKHFSHGFMSDLGYTWSHEIDDGQGSATNAIFGFSDALWTYNGQYAFDKGSGALDQRHRIVYSFIYAPTFTHSNNAFAKYVVNGWQLASITTIASGRPAGSPTVHLTDTPVTGMLYSASALNGFNGAFRVPFWPVNSLYTPWTQTENLRLTKNIPLPREGMHLALNFEAFNVANNWSPTALQLSQAYNETKGVLTYTPTQYGYGTSDGGFPDGTQARRLQVSARLVF